MIFFLQIFAQTLKIYHQNKFFIVFLHLLNLIQLYFHRQAEVEAEQPGAAHNESLEEDIDFATYVRNF